MLDVLCRFRLTTRVANDTLDGGTDLDRTPTLPAELKKEPNGMGEEKEASIQTLGEGSQTTLHNSNFAIFSKRGLPVCRESGHHPATPSNKVARDEEVPGMLRLVRIISRHQG